MIYRLLGELEIGEGSRLLHLPGGPTLVVLAALLVNANRRMSKTELIRVAWGGDGVEEAQLYKRVKAVRDLLAEMGHGDHLKTHPRFGYEMRAAEDDVDALMFQRLVLEADEAGAEQRTEDEIGHLRHALRLLIGSGVACSAVGGIADLMTDLPHDGASGCGPGSRSSAGAVSR